MWDQGRTPDEGRGEKPPQGFRTGVEYNARQINEAIRLSRGEEAAAGFSSVGIAGEAVREALPAPLAGRDASGHGTAVAAIAASSHPDVFLQGVAPGASLLAVKLAGTKENDFPGTTQLMRGVAYALRKSLELNMPLVINLSYGNSYGSHDGHSLLERFLDNAGEAGRSCICVGCGNEGASGGHLAANVREERRVELAVEEGEPTLNVQLWKSYEDSFGVELESPGGERYSVVFSEQPGRQEAELGQTKALIYVGQPTPYSSLQELFFVFLPLGTYVDAGIWVFRFTPERIVSGNIQLYLPAALQRNTGTRFFRPSPDLTLTIPSTAAGVISVGAYDDSLEAYADFSGRGLTDSGRIYLESEGGKPDIVAPGVGLVAARAGGGVESYTGTSFSAPMASGSVALLMEWGIVRGNDPYLYGEKVKAYLRKGARPVRGVEGYPNNRVGWGALCVGQSLPG